LHFHLGLIFRRKLKKIKPMKYCHAGLQGATTKGVLELAGISKLLTHPLPFPNKVSAAL